MKNGVLAVIFLFFLFYFCIPSALALGISPARITMDFVPNYESEFEGQVINSGGSAMPVDIFFDKDLAQYMTLLTPSYVEIPPNQAVTYKFKLKLPSEFETPGYHWGIIWAQQHIEAEAAGAVARVKVGAQVLVKVPYPGKYAVIKLNIENANVNDTVIFEIEATNFGKENITNAKGEIRIMDLDNKTIVILQTEGKPIQTTKTETLQATWFSDIDPGLYNVEAVLYYDGETAELRETFNLGAPLIKITNVSAQPIVNGTIGKILAEIHSFWNLNIEDVYIEFSIRTLEEREREIYNDKSQTIVVGPFKTYVVTVYWDTTRGFDLGDYKGVLILHYLDQNETAEIDLELIAKPGITIGTEILILIFVVIAVIVVVLFFFFYRKRRERYKQKKLM